ncbi:MAG: acyl-CoA dehydrogenase [Acidobacteria bacterium]|nr:acyl-CoA dehydrogenase [Acidobacteriota bacterium]
MTESADANRLPLTTLSVEEELFRSSVRKYAIQNIAPRVREMDERGEFSSQLLQEFFRLGWMGMEIPEEFGGSGGSFFHCILAVEELSAVDPSAAVIVDIHNTVVNKALLRWANENQKHRFLPRLAADTLGAFALSEAGSGSDAFSLSTQAEDRGDFFLLRGRKLWITNAAEAGLFIVFANANPAAGHRGITAFLVDRDTPGCAVGRKEDKLGIRASSTCELILEDCGVPRENVLGKVGEGYKIAIETLNEGRIGIGAQMVGLAQGALSHAIEYAQERQQFGSPIADFQAVQFQLAEMATKVEAARLMVYNAARLRECHQPFIKEAAMAKYFSSQVAEEVASAAIEIFGGYGFVKDYPVEKLYRDAKIGKIYEGTSNMQLQTIAKLLLKQ